MSSKPKLIALANDHNGVNLKEKLKTHLIRKSFEVVDLGPVSLQPSVDYADFAFQVSHFVATQKVDCGILICGTGIGMSIAANRTSKVRAALVHNEISARKSREHNNANILCLGSWVNEDSVNIQLADIWLDEPFGEGRHVSRVKKIDCECFQNDLLLALTQCENNYGI